ncbi:glycosyltransferase [Kineococcus rhizosphaerae]|uniref:Glycosyltransferase involved in cell wall biosynthesis n=1 Tax=Kineococcus rhizosphaerae TaxID=559628 RepID=A0A2T0RBC2_9ACTN|nr:glycosyltransferase [Kineococcus rhizosphaerae]PRY18431.1 glycosyltransferase involved in cell wall biosynthesis [Kineococcus rhizosphaerae]
MRERQQQDDGLRHRVLHRVLHVAQPTTAGVARCVVDLVRHQVATGLDVHLACPTDGWLASAARGAGARVHPWAATRTPGPSVLVETRRLARIVARVDPGLVHLHSAKAGLAGRLAVRGRRPTVFQPHGWSFLAVSGPVRAATTTWERAGVRWADRVVCVSEAERSAAAALGLHLEGSAVVVPNGVDVRHFRPADRRSARVALDLPPGPVAVCVGRLSEQKGQDLLLAAWPRVRERVAGARLVLVGEGPELGRLREAAGAGVQFAGAVDDPRQWYAAADVVVVPSRWEGMALVPLEASASGRSVVVTDVHGARESVPRGAGSVVPVADVDALGDAVAVRLDDLATASREGAAGRRHVQEHHRLGDSAERVSRLYRDVLRERCGVTDVTDVTDDASPGVGFSAPGA